MNEIAHPTHRSVVATPRSGWSDLIRQDDWWAIWIGLGLVVVAAALFAGGGDYQMDRGSTAKMESLAGRGGTVARSRRAIRLACSCCSAVLFGIGASALGIRLTQFLPAFAAGLPGIARAVFPRTMGPGLALQPGAAAGGAGAGPAGLQYGRSAAVGGCRTASRTLHQDRHRAAGGGFAADADRLGGPGRHRAGGHRLAGDVRRHLL